MIVNPTFTDIARHIKEINKISWLVKVCVVVTTRHIICITTDGDVEFFRYPTDNVKAFLNKLFILRQAMLNFDYKDLGPIRVNISHRYSKKLFELWKQANENKLLKLS